jgi:protein gp37
MSANSKIEWTDHTFNPWIGCTKVSPACDHCYAEVSTPSRTLGITWGAGQSRRLTSESNWKEPIKWNKRKFYQCSCGWRGHEVSTEGTSLTDGLPSCPECDGIDLREARQRVFCASLADVFDNEVTNAWRQRLMSLVAATPNLDWLFLTKRIGNATRMLQDASEHDGRLMKADDSYRPPENLWIGATICNQEEADRDIPKLLSVPAAVRFLSMEPLLGPVNLRGWLDVEDQCPCGEISCEHEALDWVIVGGESGPHARPMHPDWASSLRDQCAVAGVPFLFKQWGEWIPRSACYHTFEDGRSWADIDPSATRWPCIRLTEQGLNGRDLANAVGAGDEAYMQRVGKKAAGRLLDGRTHDEFPESAA